jgi:hypothetical protein
MIVDLSIDKPPFPSEAGKLITAREKEVFMAE